MKYKLLRDLPMAKAGEEVSYYSQGENCYVTFTWEFAGSHIAIIKNRDIYEWLEPIVEKKTYDDLKEGDSIYSLDFDGNPINNTFLKRYCRSETFLTREEAEDEHKRREWAFRKDKFIPKYDELYYFPRQDGIPDSWGNTETAGDFMIINAGLAFRSAEDCQEAIDKHDLIRLFYTIR